ncbi:NAD(P)-binding protein [Lindgomyces ingoldianus]|uniref:NAD(P)-binding protein n=1 Tax=Lindgomyces ingoldianus TaxID=673940 RepID=A0ACB6QIF3_9PLEO|nr:NAD(P)-binding protein [Lindgomyces ingoldianus]KAF2465921.1 NAD(P)-binding protein [Lindgomyces ingoldianus]
MSNNAEFQVGEIFNVKRKVALVTGGGSGRAKEKLDRVAGIYGKGIEGQIIPIVGDASSMDGVKNMVKGIESREKCLENAEELWKNLFDPTSVEEWTSLQATNVLLATEIAKAGLKIRMNSIAPGVFPTEMTTQDSKENQKSEIPKGRKGSLPAQCPGKDQDMAAAILFAASCQYRNGHTVPVDGGYLI